MTDLADMTIHRDSDGYLIVVAESGHAWQRFDFHCQPILEIMFCQLDCSMFLLISIAKADNYAGR